MITAQGNAYCAGAPLKLGEMSLQQLVDVVLEVENVDDGNDACGEPCPYSTNRYAYCGRRERHSASDPDHHFTQIDVYEFAAPRLAEAVKRYLR